MKKQVVKVPQFYEVKNAKGQRAVPLSAATKANGFVFVSGLPPTDPATGKFLGGDIASQTRRSLENLKMTLEAAGSSLDRVMKTTIYCTNVAHFEEINEIYREYFPSEYPARTFVNVGSWPRKFDIEIEAVALAGDE